MSFDKDSSEPVMNVHRRTTQVNLSMTAGVLLFLIVCGVLIWWYARDPGETADDVHREVNTP